MTLEKIKTAVESGQTVHWASGAYNVVKDDIGQWLIVCPSTGGCWGLTKADKVTLNGREDQFFIEGQAMPLKVGDIVKYSKPQPGEEPYRFKLREVNGDRVLIELICRFTIKPLETVEIGEICVA